MLRAVYTRFNTLPPFLYTIDDIHDRLTNQVAANLKLVNFIHDLTVQDVVVSMYTNMLWVQV